MLSYVLKQLYSFIPDAELEDRILKYNPIPSNVPPPAPFSDFLRGVLEENHKYLQMLGINFDKKCSKKYLMFWVLCQKFGRKLKTLLSVKLIELK